MPRLTKHFKRVAALRPHSRRDEARGKRRDSEDGQALVEFALVLPLVVLIMLGLLLFGLALNGWIDETQLASEAARFAAVDSEHGTGTLPESEPKAFLKWITEQGDSKNVKNATATICAPSSTVGQPVEVKLEYTYNWLGLASLLGVEANTKIASTATERIAAAPSPGEAYPTKC
jgi:Flp pilus assembly protein TadG